MSHNSESFNFNRELKPTQWLVDHLIPLGHLIFCLARSSQGKSWFAEALAIKMIFGKDFLGRKVQPGDVLIIDQDTPKDTIQHRLIEFGKKYRSNPKHKLFLKSHEGLSISNKSLLKAIEEHPTAKLIILDSYHSIVGALDTNSTNDTNLACNQLKRHLTPDRTIWVNHHISEKKLLSLQDLMFGDSIGNLFMGNSAMMQQADTVFIMNGMSNNGVLHEMYVRPHGKRAYISQTPFLATFDNYEFEHTGDLEDMRNQDECVCDLRILLAATPEEGFTVKMAHEKMGHKHGWVKLREALAHMETVGEARMERGAANQFRYYPTENTRKPRIIVSGVYIDEKDSD